MIKKLILILACTVALNANLNVKIKNIIGPSAYNKHKNLINYAFSNKNAYYNNGQVNYVLLTSKLQNNGLLKLRYGSTKYIDVTFKIKGNEKKSLAILKDSLKSLGHYYYFTKEASNTDNFKWTIKLKTEAAISPLALSRALAKRKCKVTDIRKEGSYKWYYAINGTNCQVNKTKSLISNNQISLKKTFKPYMIQIANANAVNIISKSGNRWHPSVIFYDDKLNVLEVFKENSLQKSLRLDVPIDTKYIKIDDLYSLSNLKRGISITKE